MAQLTFFRYIHKDTVLHRMDGRLKLICMLLLSLSASFASELQDYLVPLSLLLCALFSAKLPLTALFKDLKFFALIILMVVLVNAFNMPGDPIPNFPIPGLSRQGIITGLRFTGRLLIIILVCTVMTGTTPLSTFRNVIEWFLRPVPFLPAARIATMINLTFLLIPVVFELFAEMHDAQKARCAELRKNPVKRISFLVFPLLNQMLRRTEEIIDAMEARCYSEVRTNAIFRSHKIDWLILALCLAVFLFILR